MRILAECKQCHIQYDVTDAGGAVECRKCHVALSIVMPRAKLAKVVRCGACGASRGDGGENCHFCGARFSAADNGWGSMCPGCYCRLPMEAHYCVECGLKISPVKLDAEQSALKCPRCTCELTSRKAAEESAVELHECPGCAGTWLDAETFDAVCSHKEKTTLSARVTAAKRKRLNFELSEKDIVRYVPCPVCAQLMNRRNFASISGVIIDVCRDHGVWLDNQELGRIVQFITAGGMDKSRLRVKEAADHTERMKSRQGAGMLLPLSGDTITHRRSSGVPLLDGVELAFATVSLLGEVFFSD